LSILISMRFFRTGVVRNGIQWAGNESWLGRRRGGDEKINIGGESVPQVQNPGLGDVKIWGGFTKGLAESILRKMYPMKYACPRHPNGGSKVS